MKKEVLYTYLGTNGTITTPIFIEGAYHIKKVRLVADKDKFLTNDFGITKKDIVLTTEQEVENWIEIDNLIFGQN